MSFMEPEPDEIGTEEFRDFDNVEDTGPKHRSRPPLRNSKSFQLLTFGVLAFSILWLIASSLVPSIHASRLTFTGFLACLIFYSGEYIAWERPRIPKRKPREPKGRHQWRER